MKKNSLYLYGTDNIPEIPAWLREQRVALLVKHRDELVKDGLVGCDTVRLTHVLKAIKFWEEIK